MPVPQREPILGSSILNLKEKEGLKALRQDFTTSCGKGQKGAGELGFYWHVLATLCKVTGEKQTH